MNASPPTSPPLSLGSDDSGDRAELAVADPATEPAVSGQPPRPAADHLLRLAEARQVNLAGTR